VINTTARHDETICPLRSDFNAALARRNIESGGSCEKHDFAKNTILNESGAIAGAASFHVELSRGAFTWSFGREL
jgi:hypothetical protein